eukprot:XP_015570655.1 uncharacterized protein LOC8287063 isoform X1 [Ricinus communis]
MMEPIHLNNYGTSIEEPIFEQLIHPSSEISGIAGDPQVNPRVGDEYQAEIPTMISESERSRLLVNPYDSEGMVDSSHSFLMGLPFPVAWVHNKTNDEEDKGCRMNIPENSFNANASRKSRTSMKKKGSKQNADPLDLGLGDGQESKPANLGSKVAVKANLPQLHKNENCDLVPGSFNHSWSDAEVNSFILGLYIFGKSFLQIKRFMDNKEMGDILCFYYGNFYASDVYHRWSDCQKKKRKKCIYGQKLFTGWRQQELLSRLHCHVPEHSQSTLLEVSTAFSEGKLSLEDYVFNLKASVGIQALVDAIGIGKGREDLTSLAMETGKNNPLFAGCPIGKACSSLTSSDIIKLLTGGFRLSKARCNDIFWEAVWPRLLARGWHSEQPKNQIYMGSSHCLVFLIPGVKKFSKRKLVKGNHYFDSVSDVLSKVASEPKLIELETEEVRGSIYNEEDRWVAEVSSDQDDPSIRQSHRYLKPRVSSCNLNLVRFTIVDSGLVDGGKLSKMREMRYAPDDLKVKSMFTTLSSNIEVILLENLQNDNELQVTDNSVDGPKNINKVECCKRIFNGCGSNHTKFTIVDTSLIDLGKSSMVRELRYAPVGVKVASEMSKSSKKNEGNSSMESLDWNVPVATNKLLNGEKDACKSDHSEDVIGSSSSEKKEVNRDFRNKLVESLQDNNHESAKNQSTRSIKHKFSRRPKSGNSNNLVPVVKRRRLTACANTEISHVIENFSVGLGSKQEESCCPLNSIKEGSSRLQGITPQKLSLTTSLVEGCLEESAGSMLDKTLDGEASHGTNAKHQSPSLIDFNLPEVPFYSEALMDAESSQGSNVKLTCFPSNLDKPDSEALSASVDACTAAEKPGMNPRRQSTRNRPLTTRALEALECGFMGSVKRQKSMQVQTQELPLPSSSRWSHIKVKFTASRGKIDSGIVDAKEGETTGTLNRKNLSTKLPTEQKKSC